MLDNLLFSMTVALPIFLVMLIGYGVKQIGFVDANFVKMANRMIFNVALPMKLFWDVSQNPLSGALDFHLLGFIFVFTLFSTVFSVAVGHVAVKNPKQRSSFAQGAFRGNFLYLGLSLMENMTGSIGVKTPMVVAMIIPLYNILAVLLFTFLGEGKISKAHIGKAIEGIVKNPLIIAIALGLAAAFVGLPIPVFVARTLGYFKDMVTPLALFTIGAAFEMKNMASGIRETILAAILKLAILPILGIGSAKILGFGNSDILLLFVLFGVPTATTSYIMAAMMGGDDVLASNIVMLTTLISVFSMTAFIFVFKSTGMI
jgi:hypothetical protein